MLIAILASIFGAGIAICATGLVVAAAAGTVGGLLSGAAAAVPVALCIGGVATAAAVSTKQSYQ
jgi:hypothetical protein